MKDRREAFDEIEIDLREIFYVLRSRVLAILLAGILFASAAAIWSFFLATPSYQATSKLYILTQSTSITSLADIQVGSSLAMDYMELIKSRPVVNQVKRNLGLDFENEAITEEMLSIKNPENTRIIKISISSDDPQVSADMANEFAKVAKRKISEIMQTDEPTMVETAIVPPDPIKPKKAKNIMLGFVLGVFLSAFAIIVLHILNDSIRSQDDIERYLGLNTLVTVPYVGDKKKKITGKKKIKKGNV